MKVKTYVWHNEFPFWGPIKGFLSRQLDKDNKENNICIIDVNIVTYVYSDTIEDYDGFRYSDLHNEA